jgi:hypothetical protein
MLATLFSYSDVTHYYGTHTYPFPRFLISRPATQLSAVSDEPLTAYTTQTITTNRCS